MRFLLVRPHISLTVAKRLQAFLHLEPLALELVAGGIDPAHETRILDLASESDPDAVFRRTLAEWQPEVVGITGYSVQAQTIKKLAAAAKEIVPRTVTVAGGVHATLVPQDLKLPGIVDLVVRGEGGSVMPVLVRNLEAKGPLPQNPVFLPTASPDFDRLAAMPPPALPDYDQVPAPRRDLVDRSRYFCIWYGRPGERLPTLFPQTAAVRTSVGCPHRCSFCVVHYLAGGKYRQRAPAAVVAEIATVSEDHIYFVDDEMFIDAARAERIARLLLERGIRKHYISWARADTICRHPGLFRLWKEAGLSLLYVGIESMDPETLRQYNKGIDPDVNARAVAILRELGIGLHAALMINPEFTAADFRSLKRTVEFVTPAEVSFTVFSPPPGTPLWHEHKDRFICPDPYAFYDCQHTLLPTALPLKRFYGCMALALLTAFRRNPWLHNRVRVPLRDFVRFIGCGLRYGWALRNIYRDYREPGLESRRQP